MTDWIDISGELSGVDTGCFFSYLQFMCIHLSYQESIPAGASGVNTLSVLYGGVARPWCGSLKAGQQVTITLTMCTQNERKMINGSTSLIWQSYRRMQEIAN